jgi:hypothetical protein
MPSALALKLFGAGKSLRIERRKERKCRFLTEGNLRLSQPFQTFFVGLQVTSVLK